MSHSILVSLLVAGSSLASAGHIHQRPNHEHVARQVPAALSNNLPPNAQNLALPVSSPVLPISAPVVPIAAPAPNIGDIAEELETCLTKIPADLTALVAAIDARLQDVQSQISSILGGGFPSGLPVPLPSVVPSVPANGLPTGLPAVSPPALSIPALPTTAVPPFSLPIIPIQPPTVNFQPTLIPSVSLPVNPIASLPVPPVASLPGVPAASPPGLPAASLPGVPAASLPGVPAASLPGVPAASLPGVAVPSVPVSPTVPQVSILPIAAPNLNSLPVPNPPALTTPRLPSVPVAVPSPSRNPLPIVNFGGQSVTFSTAIPTELIKTVPQILSTVTNTLTASEVPVSIVPTTSAYIFNADARDNLAVYYGNTQATAAGGLAELCTNRNVDIVVLSFIYDFFSANGYPSTFFGTSSCAGQTDAQAARAPGLRNCAPLAQQITECQTIGKKVLVSLGGYIANSSFTSDLEARQFAITLWNLFGGGSGQDADLRPFGSVVVDGFDIDNEDGRTAHWDTFASAMRALFNSATSKRFYLSASPQCPYPDASIPLSVLQHADFVWPQFYNNPSCNLDSPGFEASFVTWSRSLTSNTTTDNNNAVASTNASTSRTATIAPKLYVGAPAFPDVSSGYVEASSLSTRISLAKSLLRSNFGGIMLWDGSEGLRNFDPSGNTYLDYSKWSLQY